MPNGVIHLAASILHPLSYFPNDHLPWSTNSPWKEVDMWSASLISLFLTAWLIIFTYSVHVYICMRCYIFLKKKTTKTAYAVIWTRMKGCVNRRHISHLKRSDQKSVTRIWLDRGFKRADTHTQKVLLRQALGFSRSSLLPTKTSSMLHCTAAQTPAKSLLFGSVILLICVSLILFHWLSSFSPFFGEFYPPWWWVNVTRVVPTWCPVLRWGEK